MAWPQVVRLALADHLLGAVEIGDAERALEAVAPVVALAAIVRQSLKRRFVGREMPGHGFECDPNARGVDRAAGVFADDHWFQLIPGGVHGELSLRWC